MNSRRAAIAGSLCGLLGACASAGRLPPPQGAAQRLPVKVDSADAEQEALYSAAMSRAGLSVRVNSNGCTRKADFQIQVLDGYPAATVILKRTRPDRCRAFVASGVDLVFSYQELGIGPTAAISLANPLVSDPTPGR